MKERPILFSAPMVRAILEGRKTQTRRIVKPQPRSDQIMPREWSSVMRENPNAIYGDGLGWTALDADGNTHEFRCPYGQPGDRLWVREAWRDWSDAAWHYAADGLVLPKQRDRGLAGFLAQRAPLTWESYKWRPSIHMPRAASRILLEVVRVRVERLNDISEVDAMAEGVVSRRISTGDARTGCREAYGLSCDDNAWAVDARQAYEYLWESINGPGSWEANPLVWVVEFKRALYETPQQEEPVARIEQLEASVVPADERIARLRRGNTALLEALMDMVNQFFHHTNEHGQNDKHGEIISHSFISAEERAIAVLIKAGMAEDVKGKGYRLLWDKLEARKREVVERLPELSDEELAVESLRQQLAAAQTRIDAIGEASLNAQAKFQQREKELLAHIGRLLAALEMAWSTEYIDGIAARKLADEARAATPAQSLAHRDRVVKDLISEVYAADDALSRGDRDKALLGVRLASTAASLVEHFLSPTPAQSLTLHDSRIEQLEADVAGWRASAENRLEIQSQREEQLAAMAAERDKYRKRVERLHDFLRDLAENFDCDSDAHKHGTMCRRCAAKALLDATQAKPACEASSREARHRPEC